VSFPASADFVLDCGRVRPLGQKLEIARKLTSLARMLLVAFEGTLRCYSRRGESSVHLVRSRMRDGMQTFRRNAKQFIIRSGLGPFRPYVDAMSAFAKYGVWLKKNSSVPVFSKREDMYDYLNLEIISGEPVDYLEFGVYQGYTIKYWSTINSNPNSRFYGFDSFEGLPEDWSGAFVRVPKGTFATEGMVPEIDDSRVGFHKGWFQNSLPLFLHSYKTQNRLLIHCDADLYTSTLYVLCTLHNFFKPGSLIIFDEFSSASHEFRAFMDYTSSFLQKFRVVAQVGSQCDQVAVQVI
jgi:O-methyltransferase